MATSTYNIDEARVTSRDVIIKNIPDSSQDKIIFPELKLKWFG
jgi:hypothetical protein